MSDLIDLEVEKEKHYWQTRADEAGRKLDQRELQKTIARPWWMKLRAAGSDTYRTPEGMDCKGEVMDWYARDTASRRQSKRREVMSVHIVSLAEVHQDTIDWLTTPSLDGGGSISVTDDQGQSWFDLAEATEDYGCEISSVGMPPQTLERPANMIGVAVSLGRDLHSLKPDVRRRFNKVSSIVVTTFCKILVMRLENNPWQAPTILRDFFSSSHYIFAAHHADVVLAYLDDYEIDMQIRDAATAFEPGLVPFADYMSNPAFANDIPLLRAQLNVIDDELISSTETALAREACLAALVVVRYPGRATVRTAHSDKFDGAKQLIKLSQMEELAKPSVREIDFDKAKSFTRQTSTSSDQPPALVLYCNRFHTMPSANNNEVIEVKLTYDYYKDDGKRHGTRIAGLSTVMRGCIRRTEGRLVDIVFPKVLEDDDIGGSIPFDQKADKAESYHEPPSFRHVRETIVEICAIGPQLPSAETLEAHNYALDLMDAETSRCPDNSSFNAVVFPPLAQDGDVAKTEIERAVACSFYSTMGDELGKPQAPSKLTKMQAKVFAEAFDTTFHAQVVSGPPGTGKSFLIASICKAYSDISSAQERWHDLCLVLTRTNAAAVDVAKELVDVGCPFIIFKGGKQTSFYEGKYYAAVEDHARDTESVETPDAAWATLKGKNVVVCTLGKFEVIKDNVPWTPTLALVHGASEIAAPRMSQSLQGMRGLAKLILLGDAMQIPPYGRDRSLNNRSALSYAVESSKSTHALIKCKHHTLDVTLRLPPALADFISTNLYGGVFHSSKAPDRLGWKSCLRFYVVKGSSEERKDWSSSLCNPSEARAVVQIVQKFVERQRKSWRILTFYSGQKREIENELVDQLIIEAPVNNGERMEKRHLTRTEASDLVSTVDAFQGKEAEVIIISTVRTEVREKGGNDIVSDPRRLNVALTRCSDKLVVVTSSAFLSGLEGRCQALLFTDLASEAPRATDFDDPFFS